MYPAQPAQSRPRLAHSQLLENAATSAAALPSGSAHVVAVTDLAATVPELVETSHPGMSLTKRTRKDISKALLAAGIEHKGLRANAAQVNLNLNLTDAKRVLVKVSRAGSSGEAMLRECHMARVAAANGVLAPTPLTEPFTVTDDGGRSRVVSVWPFVKTRSAPSLAAQSLSAMDAIVLMATSPVPAEVHKPLDLVAQKLRVQQRLAGRTDSTALGVVASSDEAFDECIRLSAGRPARWIHGDLHLQNVLWGRGGQRILIDWESTCLGFPEFDVGTLIRSILALQPQCGVEERLSAVRAVIAEAHLRGFDEELVWTSARARLLSAAAHLMNIAGDPRVIAEHLRWYAAIQDGLAAAVR